MDNPHTSNHSPDETITDRRSAFIGVAVLEAAIIVVLWLLGRMFS
jgi:hypothetical protein